MRLPASSGGNPCSSCLHPAFMPSCPSRLSASSERGGRDRRIGPLRPGRVASLRPGKTGSPLATRGWHPCLLISIHVHRHPSLRTARMPPTEARRPSRRPGGGGGGGGATDESHPFSPSRGQEARHSRRRRRRRRRRGLGGPEAGRRQQVPAGHVGERVAVAHVGRVEAHEEAQHHLHLPQATVSLSPTLSGLNVFLCHYICLCLSLPRASLPSLPPSQTRHQTSTCSFARARVRVRVRACQEEAVDGDVEAEGGEGVARVIVVPQAQLHLPHHSAPNPQPSQYTRGRLLWVGFPGFRVGFRSEEISKG